MSQNHGASTGRKAEGKKVNNGVAVPLTPAQKPSQRINGENKPGQNGTRAGTSSSSNSPPLRAIATNFEPSVMGKYLVQNSTIDASPAIVDGSRKSNGKQIAPIGTRDGVDLTVAPKTVFTTDNGPGLFPGGHYLVTKVKDHHDVQNTMAGLNKDFGWQDKLLGHKIAWAEYQPQTLLLYLHFDDTRDAARARDDAPVVNAFWQLQYCTQFDYEKATKRAFGGNKDQSEFGDGQVKFVARFEGNKENVYDADVPATVRSCAERFGEILAFIKLDYESNDFEAHFRVEFFSILAARTALRAMSDMDPQCYGNWWIAAQLVYIKDSPASTNSPPSIAQYTNSPPPVAEFTSPSGRTAWNKQANGTVMAVAAPFKVPKLPKLPQGMDGVYDPEVGNWRDRMLSAPAVPGVAQFGTLEDDFKVLTMLDDRAQSFSGVSGPRQQDENEPQFIRCERIASGLDCRTTIMLRNLPSTWYIHHFLAALDTVCKGKYDFSYLRIDFETGKNVGYGFCNFTKAEYIIPFYKKFVGKEWQPGAHPKKIAQVSYATIQGIDCLTEKFRNSAIMGEFPEYTPKLWYVEGMPETAGRPDLIGESKPFPPPNNPTKKQRSDDNARTVGLYAPRGGARNRGGRRSNYDRGTMHQMQEEAMLNQSPPPGPAYGQDANYTLVPRPQFQQPMYQAGMQGFPQPQPPMPYYNGPAPHPGWHYQAPPPPAYYGQYAGPAYGPPHPPQQGYAAPAPYPYQQMQVMPQGNVAPASRLRTMTRGALGGRPQNVTVAPQGYVDAGDVPEAGPSQTGYIPRAFGAMGEHETAGYQQAPQAYGGAVANGSIPFNYPQYQDQ